MTFNSTHAANDFTASILIVDDHAAVRRGLRTLISTRPGWVICGEAADGEQAIALALQLKPSVIVMDISMPVMDGLEATRHIREELPGVEVVIVSQHDSEHVVSEAQRVGARGFVMKSHLSADLLPSLEAALLHSSRISAPVSKAWQDALSSAKRPPAGPFIDPGPHDDLDLMSGGGEMGSLMRSKDWATTPFGPVSSWPQSLRTALRICLDSRFPILIWWGPELRLLYNDAYRPALGTTKYPNALGAPGRDVWSDIWDTIGPMLEGVMRTGQATWENDQLLLFDRHGYVEESYWTYSYSAIRLASGEVGGVFSAIHEVTDRVLSARRLKTLREVADQLVQAKNEKDACTLAMQSIMRNPADCPHAMIFLCEGEKATRIAASFDAGPYVQSAIDLAEDDEWRISETVRTRVAQVFRVKNPESMPNAPYGAKCEQAISIPILGTTREAVAVITVGVSPYRALDEEYREFFELLARNLAANVNNAKAYDDERKRAEALAELDRAKTVFFSNVSHEFRTPLTLMLGPLEDSLAEHDTLSEEQRERLQVAHRNSLRLLKLVNTLLDFSRIEAERIQASYEPVELSMLTADLASVFQSAAGRAGLRLIVNTPPLSEPVYIDREMWEKIVFNLLSNALKFTFAGEIEVSLEGSDGFAKLSVRDTGTGIPQEELPHLFERFYRVKGARGRTFEGSGIGLALVQELAKLHGGTVQVESILNQGSTFTVSIPLGCSHLPAERIGAVRTLEPTGMQGEAYVQEALRWLPPSEADPDVARSVSSAADTSRTVTPHAEKARILLADDNSDMRQYVERLLRSEYEVITVGDGESALRSARQRRPDLILSDVMMPRLDGFALLQAVRTDAVLKDVPVILLSARAGEESRIEGLRAGADDYLVKPFSARELLACVRSHLATAHIRLQTQQQLAAEAEVLAKLNECSLRLWRSRSLKEGLDEMLTAVLELLGADKGNIQLRDQDRGALAIAVQRGFQANFLEFFEQVYANDASACGRALGSGERVVVEDIETDLNFARLRSAAREAGFRSVVSTPLVGRQGALLGVVSAHFPTPHRPSDQDLRRLDLYVLQASDFIQRWRTDEALRESEERLRALVNASSYGIYRMSPDWKEMRQLDGRGFLSDTRSASTNWLQEYIYPDDQQRVLQTIQHAIATKSLFELEHRVRRADGGVGWTLSRAVPLLDQDGNITEWFGTATDVTARKRAEERERQVTGAAVAATAKFRAIFEQTTQFAGIMSTDGLLVDANRLSLESCGFSAAEVLGRPFWKTLWWRDFPESQRKIREATALAAQGIPYREMLHYSGTDRTERLVDFALFPIVDTQGQVLFLHPTGVDITHQKTIEENYRRLNESLETEVRARTRELEKRNAEVVMQTDQLRDLSWHLLQTQDEERRHVARELHDSAGQTLSVLGISIAQLVERVSRMSPDLAGAAQEIQEIVQQLHREIRTTSYLLHPPLLDESGLSSALSWYVQGLVERSGLKISLDIPEDLGRLSRQMELVVFRLVQECVTNIHRHSGSTTAQIKLTRGPQGITIDVGDQGRGMTPEKLTEIHSGGSGVGVRGMRERLRQFDGTMSIESGKSGTRIMVTIPIPNAPLPEGQDGAPLQAAV